MQHLKEIVLPNYSLVLSLLKYMNVWVFWKQKKIVLVNYPLGLSLLKYRNMWVFWNKKKSGSNRCSPLNSSIDNNNNKGNSTVLFFWERYPLVGNLLYQITKTSYLMALFSNRVVLTSHVIVLLSYSIVPLFFLTFDGTTLTLCSTNITDVIILLLHSVVPLFFFLTFDGTILTLCSHM